MFNGSSDRILAILVRQILSHMNRNCQLGLAGYPEGVLQDVGLAGNIKSRNEGLLL
jgi:hypothetical protein